MVDAWLKGLQLEQAEAAGRAKARASERPQVQVLWHSEAHSTEYSSGILTVHFRLELAEINCRSPGAWNSFSYLILTLRIKENKTKQNKVL